MVVLPRYRVSFTKNGSARFISHLDMIRTFERSLRRAGLPVALSQGFNPHAKISFGFPLPVGVTGLEEYMDVELAEDISAGMIAVNLSNCLPLGFKIKGVCILKDNVASLMAQIESSVYLAIFDDYKSEDIKTLGKHLEEFMVMPEILVKRQKKNGTSSLFDIRPGILALNVYDNANSKLAVQMELMSNSSINVRPREVLQALWEQYGVLGQDCRSEIIRSKVMFKEGMDLFGFCSGPVERP